MWPPLTRTLSPSGLHLPIPSDPVAPTYPYPQPQSIQFTSSYSFFLLRCILILSFHLCRSFPTCFFPFMFPHQNPVFISLFPQKCNTANLNPCITFGVCTNNEADCCTSASQGNQSDVCHDLTRGVAFVTSLSKV